MICLRFFNGCLSQILLGSFLNTLSHLRHEGSFLKDVDADYRLRELLQDTFT